MMNKIAATAPVVIQCHLLATALNSSSLSFAFTSTELVKESFDPFCQICLFLWYRFVGSSTFLRFSCREETRLNYWAAGGKKLKCVSRQQLIDVVSLRCLPSQPHGFIISSLLYKHDAICLSDRILVNSLILDIRKESWCWELFITLWYVLRKYISEM